MPFVREHSAKRLLSMLKLKLQCGQSDAPLLYIHLPVCDGGGSLQGRHEHLDLLVIHIG